MKSPIGQKFLKACSMNLLLNIYRSLLNILLNIVGMLLLLVLVYFLSIVNEQNQSQGSVPQVQSKRR